MSWKTKRLGELCRIELGATPARRNPNYYDEKKETGNAWLSIRDMPKTIGEELFDSKEYLSDEGAEKVKLVKKGTLLFSFKLTIGRICFAGQDLRTNEAIAALSVKNEKELNKKYLAWYLSSQNWDEITAKDEKLLGKTLNKSKLNVLSISYPSLQEQKRIVGILDEAFAGIDQAITNTEKNLQNARDLFESYLNNIFTQKGDGLVDKKLGDVIDVLTDYHANGSYKVLKQHVELKEIEDYAWMVRSTDFEKKFKNLKRYIDEHAYNYLSKSKLFGGEIIMSKIGNAGKVYLMPMLDRPCSLAMNLFLIRLNSNVANNEFVFRYLNSKKGVNQIKPMLNGAATQTITKDSVRSLLIPLPPIDIQNKAVGDLKILEIETKRLEATYTQKLTALKELKQSLLQKAFAGELTADMHEAA